MELDIPRRFTLHADLDQINQVLDNLVENAIKFTPEGGKVTVRAGGNPPLIEVEDTGIGIAEGELSKIFQRFYRVDRSRSRETGGTGLGLAIVKHVSQRHGAELSIVSEPGQGSTFTVRFPNSRVRVPVLDSDRALSAAASAT